MRQRAFRTDRKCAACTRWAQKGKRRRMVNNPFHSRVLHILDGDISVRIFGECSRGVLVRINAGGKRLRTIVCKSINIKFRGL